MKKGDLFEGIVDVIEFPNKGIVTVDGERIVVKNALPGCLLYTSPSPRDMRRSRMPSSA